MKCFNCRKSFDYEKHYGICPKCGCFNKNLSEQDMSQAVHTVSNDINGQEKKRTGKRLSRSNGHLLILTIVLFTLVIGSTPISMLYERWLTAKYQKQAVESSVKEVEHGLGESFAFQDMILSVDEVQIFSREQGFPIGEDKVLVAVKMSGISQGEFGNSDSFVSDAYLVVGQQCFWQLPNYEYRYFEAAFGYPAFNPYGYWDESSEGWVAFLIDRNENHALFCLEERYGNNQVLIDTIHRISLILDVEE